MNKIYYTKPSITDLEKKYAADAAANGWGEKCYEYINLFEQSFKRFPGSEYAIATSSCTGALHMAMDAIGIGAGDEVVLADINWTATVAPVKYLGATPVFVDVLQDTWCIDPQQVEQAITDKTKAIIATHIYGNLCDMDELKRLADKYDLFLIEDAAEALGSLYKGQYAGSIADFGVFSFHGTKTITTGEGGMFVTDNEELYEKVLTLSNHGRDKRQTKQFWADEVGYKYKMSNLQAAIGCAQIQRIDELLESKRRVFSYYSKALDGVPVQLNPEKEGTVNSFWLPTFIVDSKIHFDREELLATFRQHDIDARVFFWPLSSLPKFTDKPENKIAYSITHRGVNLPSYFDLTEEQMDRVINLLLAEFR